MIIGLTGKRHVGKSEAALFFEQAGFLRVHAFDGGKVATAAYFIHLGASAQQAHEMVYGSLKDVPSSFLPGQATPRDFMEPFGKFMGTGMGPDWTLGAELARIKRDAAHRNVIVESVVYEADCLRSFGGILVRVIRPGHVGVAGMETDKAEAKITAAYDLVNDGTLADLCDKVRNLLAAMINPRTGPLRFSG